MKKVRLGHIHADVISFEGAIDALGDLIAAGKGGYVVTPNVDHVCLAEENAELRDAYAEASLSLIDGMPLLWLARAMGHPFPEKISGSDLTEPVLQRAAKDGWRVYFLGAMPGVGQRAADIVTKRYPGLQIVGVDAPDLGFEKTEESLDATLQKVRDTEPHLVFMALGCPKQELLMYRCRKKLAPAIMLGVGATLDFIAGNVQRSPQWMSNVGLEWVYRLMKDPKRLAHRYLVRDRKILRIALRMMRMQRGDRAFQG